VTGYGMNGLRSVLSRNIDLLVRSEVLTAVAMKSYVFWNIQPCSLLKVN
jgi:hypothetical protein